MSPFAASLPSTLSFPFLLGVSVHLARGFGRPAHPAKGFGAPKSPAPSSNPSHDADDAPLQLPAKSLRGKIVPCSACKGSGKKPCQFCQGTTLMVGFLGEKVPCVPCQGRATLGRPCKECGGMGYFTP